MYTPKLNSLRDRICRAIAPKGLMTMDECIGKFSKYKPSSVQTAVFQLKFYKALEESDAGYSLSDAMQRHYGGVPQREAPEFPVRTWRPLDLSRLPSLDARRPDALPKRDISFKSATEAASVYWNGAMV